MIKRLRRATLESTVSSMKYFCVITKLTNYLAQQEIYMVDQM